MRIQTWMKRGKEEKKKKTIKQSLEYTVIAVWPKGTNIMTASILNMILSIETNLHFQYCLPHLRKTKGNIIMTSSNSVFLGQSGASPYCATKVLHHFILLYDWKESSLLIGEFRFYKFLCLPEIRFKQAQRLI